MKKNHLESIYVVIFLLAFVLYVASILNHIFSFTGNKVIFILALSIMFLSLWGYLIVGKFYKGK